MSDELRAHMRELGRRGGKIGGKIGGRARGARKARSPEQVQRAVRARLAARRGLVKRYDAVLEVILDIGTHLEAADPVLPALQEVHRVIAAWADSDYREQVKAAAKSAGTQPPAALLAALEAAMRKIEERSRLQRELSDRLFSASVTDVKKSGEARRKREGIHDILER